MKVLSPAEMAATFNDRYPFVGPAFWMFSVQYFVIQVVAARAWHPAYSLLHNTISDLGNTECTLYVGRFVCSPYHSLINASFITLGVTMVIGAGLIYQEFRKTFGSAVGFGFMAVAGIGTLLVGLSPENSVPVVHQVGAFLPFFFGNLGIIILGYTLDIPRWLRTYSIISGLVALIAFALFIGNFYLGIGIGGMERVVAYPQTAWLIVFGIYISSNHVRQKQSH